MSFAELSKASSLNESHTRRILRHAMTYRIFKEHRKGFVSHTAASEMLARDELMREWLGMVTEEMWPAATKASISFPLGVMHFPADM